MLLWSQPDRAGCGLCYSLIWVWRESQKVMPSQRFPFSIRLPGPWGRECYIVGQCGKHSRLCRLICPEEAERNKHLVAHCYQLATNSRKSNFSSHDFSLFFYCEKQEDPLSQTPVVSQKVFSSCKTVWFFDTRFICIYFLKSRFLKDTLFVYLLTYLQTRFRAFCFKFSHTKKILGESCSRRWFVDGSPEDQPETKWTSQSKIGLNPEFVVRSR